MYSSLSWTLQPALTAACSGGAGGVRARAPGACDARQRSAGVRGVRGQRAGPVFLKDVIYFDSDGIIQKICFVERPRGAPHGERRSIRKGFSSIV